MILCDYLFIKKKKNLFPKSYDVAFCDNIYNLRSL